MFKQFSRRGTRGPVPAAAILFAGLALAGFGGAAQAAPITFVIDGIDTTFSNVQGSCSGAGCIPVVSAPATVEFDLENIGDIAQFDLFTIGLSNDIHGHPLTNFVSADVETTLTFSSPTTASATAGGIGGLSGGEALFFGNIVRSVGGGLLYTTQPGTVSFSDGTDITLSLAGGIGSCAAVSDCSFQVTVSGSSRLEAVPEPGSLALLGAGIVGFGAFARRRRTKRTA